LETAMAEGLRLTERDLDLFQSLSTARYLTAEQIEWLHFPAWWERWQHKQQPPVPPPPPGSAVYTRLRKLKRAALLHCLAPTVSISVDRYHRERLIWVLSQRGADVLSQARGIPLDELSYEEPREKSFLTLLHGQAIGRCYAALVTKVRGMAGLTIEDWQGDHVLSRDYDHVMVRISSKGGALKEERLPVLPDAAFTLVHPKGKLLCLIELDRGRSQSSWRTKACAYHAYMGSHALRARYGFESFVLLTVTTTEHQRQRLMRTTAEMLKKESDRYLFGLLDSVHPLTIGGCWQKVTGVTFTEQQSVGGRRGRQARIQSDAHVLLR
jgi:hypothetical protein